LKRSNQIESYFKAAPLKSASLYERQAYARYAYRILGDDPASATTERHSAARNNVTMVVDYTTPTE
jgi:hypothetical protein